MKLCTTCSRLYEARHTFCGLDGTRLSWVQRPVAPVPSPRPLLTGLDEADLDVEVALTVELDVRDTQPMRVVTLELPLPAR
jgi:hypothetical protein